MFRSWRERLSAWWNEPRYTSPSYHVVIEQSAPDMSWRAEVTAYYPYGEGQNQQQVFKGSREDAEAWAEWWIARDMAAHRQEWDDDQHRLATRVEYSR